MTDGPEPAVPLRYPKALLVGDSLTQGGSHAADGWAVRLQRQLLRRADVLNRGFSGWTSRWGARYLQGILDAERLSSKDGSFLFVSLWFGANDAQLPDGPKPAYHVPLGEYTENIRTMSRQILEKTEVLFLLTPPPVSEKNREQFSMQTYGEYQLDLKEETTKHYADALLGVAGELRREYAGRNKHVVPVDLHALFLAEKESLLPDGLHFNERGDALLSAALQEELVRLRLNVEVDPVKKTFGNSAARSQLPPVLPWHETLAQGG